MLVSFLFFDIVNQQNVVRVSTNIYYTIKYILYFVVNLYRNDQKPNHKIEMNYIKILNKYVEFKSLYNRKPLLKLGYCKYNVIK